VTGLSAYLRTALLDEVLRATDFVAPTTVYLALHTGDPGITGANEVTGGSYARQTITFAADGGTGTSLNTGTTDFASMPAVPAPGVVAFSLWDDPTAGHCLWTGWAGSVIGSFTAPAATPGVITSKAHGRSAGDQVVFEARDGVALPVGLSAGTIYFVIAGGLATDAFEISATSGGSAINLSASGEGVAYFAQPKIVANAGDTYEVAASALPAKLV
jgi:hypothetical protein